MDETNQAYTACKSVSGCSAGTYSSSAATSTSNRGCTACQVRAVERERMCF